MKANKTKLLEYIANDPAPQRLVFSNPAKKSEQYKKIQIRQVEDAYLVERYTDKQVFHERIMPEALADFVEALPPETYRQLDMWDEKTSHCVLLGKNDNYHWTTKQQEMPAMMQPRTQDRKKRYMIPEGSVVEPLVDMGIFTAEGKVVRSMYDKYKQINRFIEVLDDEAKKLPTDRTLNLIDFGCGKSYLTFIVYYYFQEIRKQSVRIVGLDLKEEVIKNCNQAAKKYGYEGLRFEVGDINGYHAEFPVDIVMTLHACDTATDFALFNAVQWNAKLILSVPCCQHELNKQMKTEELTLMTRYGIVQERFAALMTDAVRANLLQYCGYKAQILEFVDLSHTPKNLLIRAVKADIPAHVKARFLSEVEQSMSMFGIEPKLYLLLREAGKLTE